MRHGYVVLGTQAGITWFVLGSSQADTPSAAIKEVAAAADMSEIEQYVAVPSRSWQPVRGKVESRLVLVTEAEPEQLPLGSA